MGLKLKQKGRRKMINYLAFSSWAEWEQQMCWRWKHELPVIVAVAGAISPQAGSRYPHPTMKLSLLYMLLGMEYILDKAGLTQKPINLLQRPNYLYGN